MKRFKRYIVIAIGLFLVMPVSIAFAQDPDGEASDDLCAEVMTAIEEGAAETGDLLDCLSSIEESGVLEEVPELPPTESEPPLVEFVEEDTFPDSIPNVLPDDEETARSLVVEVILAPITIARGAANQAGWNSAFLDEVEGLLLSGRSPIWKLRDDIYYNTGQRLDIGPVIEGFERAFGGLIPDLPNLTQDDIDSVNEQYAE